ncbi:MAG TPA: four helix bundle protein [Balneolales bacterium]|nr:four helix bundle protein [Balneolales bacterium]
MKTLKIEPEEVIMLDLNHKRLNVWKMSLEFVATIYKLTANFPTEERYGLTSQMRRAAVSVLSNISEGAARKSPKDRKRFYEIARSSLVEIDAQLEISLRLNFLNVKNIKQASKQMNEIFAMLTKLISNT